MVEVIHGEIHGGSAGPESYGGTGPSTLIHIHTIRRNVHGNGIYIVVEGEMKIAAGQYVYARELKLNTLQVLVLTPELNRNTTHGYMAQKFIYHKGELDNYASIDVYDDAGTWESPGVGPVDGSIWLDFIAKGE
ncbi:MAG: hypothetical protein KKB59_18635 [Spirochaetes bacterium]|nr:hypothetical protein [Spirochaetota bacterium]